MPTLAPTEKVGPIALSYGKDKRANTSRSQKSKIDYSIFEGNADFLAKNYHASVVKRLKEYENPRSLLRLGDIHFSNRKFSKAVKAYIGALKLAPNSPEILKKIIACYLREEKYQDAEPFFINLINSTNNTRYINDYLNYRVFKRSNLAEERQKTKDLLMEYVGTHEDVADFRNILGLFYLSIENKPDLAKKEFIKAIEIDSRNVHAVNNVGVYYHINGKYSKALTWFSKAREIDFSYSYAYENIASSLIGLGKKTEAYKGLKKAYEDGIKLSKDWLGNLAQLSMDAESDYDLAIKILTGLGEDDPLHPGIFNNLAVAYQRLHKYEKAIENFEEARQLLKNQVKTTRRINATAPVILLNLVRLYQQLGRAKKSETVLDELIKYFPKDTQALNHKVRLLMDRRSYDDAKKMLLRITHIDSSNIEAIINLSYIYDVYDMDYIAARDILQDHIDVNAETSRGQLIINNYAYALIQLHQLDEAGSLLENLVDVREFDSTKALYSLYRGDLEKANGLYGKVLDYFKKKGDVHNLSINEAFSYYERARYLLSVGNIEDAADYVRKGLEVNVANKKLRAKLIDLKLKLSSVL